MHQNHINLSHFQTAKKEHFSLQRTESGEPKKPKHPKMPGTPQAPRPPKDVRRAPLPSSSSSPFSTATGLRASQDEMTLQEAGLSEGGRAAGCDGRSSKREEVTTPVVVEGRPGVGADPRWVVFWGAQINSLCPQENASRLRHLEVFEVFECFGTWPPKGFCHVNWTEASSRCATSFGLLNRVQLEFAFSAVARGASPGRIFMEAQCAVGPSWSGGPSVAGDGGGGWWRPVEGCNDFCWVY